MHLSVYEQSEIFRCAFLFGVFLGAFYDIFRLLRAMGLDSRRSVFIEDIVFMSCASLLCFLFAQVTVHGHFRFFTVCSHFLGFAAYRLSAGLVTGFLFKYFGIFFKQTVKMLNEGFVKTASLCRKFSANLPTIRRKADFSQPPHDKNEKNFQQF